MDRRKRRVSLTPEEIETRRIHARRRFKAVAHIVMLNRFWLEDVGEEPLGEDFRKNVKLLLKKKKEKKDLLTLEDKVLLNKPADERTLEEKAQIGRKIGSLKCFRRYPPHVKLELAGVTYFMYYGPGRVIVRQNDEAAALYFIVTGQVIVSQDRYDPVTMEMINVDLGTMEPGQLFGEVSLLHNIPRTATITTATHCEFLCLYRTDFDTILKSTLQGQWDRILRAMARFEYFDEWDEVTRRECCIMSKIVPYKAGSVIYGGIKGCENNVYFLLKGQCCLVEHLLVEVEKIAGRKSFKLFDMKKFKEEYLRADTKCPSLREDVEYILETGSIPEIEEEEEFTLKLPRVSFAQNKISEVIKPLRRSSDSSVSSYSTETQDGSSRRSTRYSTMLSEKRKSIMDKRRSTLVTSMNSTSAVTDISSYRKSVQYNEESEITITKISKPKSIPKLETIFMQICLLNELSCFGLGEITQHRQIIAVTDVTCLLVPKYWILQKNKGNLWARVVNYMNTHIPSPEEVFKKFLEHRRWNATKQNLVKSIVSKPACNFTRNVPYSIRVNFHEDLYYN